MNIDRLRDRISGATHPRILRIVAALLFFEHGTSKLLGFPPSDHSGPEFLSLSWIAGALELGGGALLIVGLFTRPVAFILSGEMAFAYWMAHAPKSAFPLAERRGRGHSLLLRVPLSRLCRRRAVEPRCTPAARVMIARRLSGAITKEGRLSRVGPPDIRVSASASSRAQGHILRARSAFCTASS